MDPIDNPTTPAPGATPTPTPTSAPTPTPISAPTPVPTSTPMASPMQDTSMASPTMTTDAAPAPTPTPAVDPVVTPEPVNPVVNPSGPADGSGLDAASSAFQSLNGVAATDPIMMPEQPPAPDPVEEELKAPMRAAEPVPGSIGSSVSGPASNLNEAVAPVENPFATNNNQTPSVSFTDPAMQPDPTSGIGAAATSGAASMTTGAGKKSNKLTLIILSIIAGVIVIVLAVILVIQLMGSNNSQSANDTIPDPSIAEVEETENEQLVCTREMTGEEVATYDGATDGIVDIVATFDTEGQLVQISRTESVVRSGDADAESVGHNESTTDELGDEAILLYGLPVDESGVAILDHDSIETNYISLDYSCGIL